MEFINVLKRLQKHHKFIKCMQPSIVDVVVMLLGFIVTGFLMDIKSIFGIDFIHSYEIFSTMLAFEFIYCVIWVFDLLVFTIIVKHYERKFKVKIDFKEKSDKEND